MCLSWMKKKFFIIKMWLIFFNAHAHWAEEIIEDGWTISIVDENISGEMFEFGDLGWTVRYWNVMCGIA